MSEFDICYCGHCRDDHGHDPKYPGSMACQMDDCDCIAFDKDEQASIDASTP